jgi:hypothetical protein
VDLPYLRKLTPISRHGPKSVRGADKRGQSTKTAEKFQLALREVAEPEVRRPDNLPKYPAGRQCKLGGPKTPMVRISSNSTKMMEVLRRCLESYFLLTFLWVEAYGLLQRYPKDSLYIS